MKRLWILMLLLMPVFAGGCKMCYSWQLGRDRAPRSTAGDVCSPVRNAVRIVWFVWTVQFVWQLRVAPRTASRAAPVPPRAARPVRASPGLPGARPPRSAAARTD